MDSRAGNIPHSIITFLAQILLIFVPLCFATSKQQPELQFQPFTSKYDGVIWYEASKIETVRYWTQAIDDFLEPYRRPKKSKNVTYHNCGDNFTTSKEKNCLFDVRGLGPCTSENFYGYHKAMPCIFLSLSKVSGWVPQYYNYSTLPANASQSLKEFSKNLGPHNMVYVACEGGNAADIENLGPVSYHPSPGFPDYYFPLSDVDEYLSPVVAVELKRPRFGIVINVVCTAWAKNIARDQKKNLGVVSIDLLID